MPTFQLRLAAAALVALSSALLPVAAQAQHPAAQRSGHPRWSAEGFAQHAGAEYTGQEFFEVPPVEAVENRYAGMPIPVDCPLNAPGWQDPHYVYYPGACDYTPPCVNHLWANYCQVPRRCKPPHHHHFGQHCGGFGSACGCQPCQASACGCGHDCHGFRLHGRKSCGCDLGCGAPSCGCATPAVETPKVVEPVEVAKTAPVVNKPKIVTVKPSVFSPASAKPVGTSGATKTAVVKAPDLSSVSAPRVVGSLSVGSYYAQ